MRRGAAGGNRLATATAAFMIVGIPFLSSCDDATARLKKAAESLAGYEVDSPPNSSWKLTGVQAVGAEKVVMRVRIDPGTEAAFGAIGRIQQSRIAQRACPSSGAKVWSYLKEEQSLWVEMEGRSGVMVETLCKP